MTSKPVSNIEAAFPTMPMMTLMGNGLVTPKMILSQQNAQIGVCWANPRTTRNNQPRTSDT